VIVVEGVVVGVVLGVVVDVGGQGVDDEVELVEAVEVAGAHGSVVTVLLVELLVDDVVLADDVVLDGEVVDVSSLGVR
jgi:hypothetical protein